MSRSSLLQIVYAALAVSGLVATWFFNLQYMQANPGGFGALHFVQQAMTTAAGSSLTVDVGIVALVASIFMFVEARRIGLKIGPVNIAIPLIIYSVCIAIASGLPLFLLLRERHLNSVNGAT